MYSSAHTPYILPHHKPLTRVMKFAPPQAFNKVDEVSPLISLFS